MAREVTTFCRVCEPACGLVATVEDGVVTALEPDRGHPVTRGFACAKGLAALDVHRDPDRLDHPLQRTAPGVFERIGWEQALDGIAARLRGIHETHGPDAIGVYIGNPTAFNALCGPAIGSFFGQLRTTRVFSSGTQDCSNKFAGSEAVFGSSTIHPIPDIDRTDHLLLLGTNPAVSHMSFVSIANPMKRLREARRRGATIRFVNPRRIESAAADVGEVILIRPDTDVYLLAAMIGEIDRLGRFDETILRERGKHVEELRRFVRRYPPERVEDVTGIPAETIRRLAREFAEAPSASVQMSTGVNMGRQGTLAYWLVHMLSFVTGNLDRPGGNLLSVGFYRSAKAGRARSEEQFFESPYGKLRRVLGSLPGNLLADEIESPSNPLRVLVVVAGNPLLTMGGEERLRRAFEGLDLLVSIDLYRNATGELADYLLPATDMLERPDVNLTGLGLQHQPWVQLTEAVVPPRAERREEWWIFAQLARKLGLRSPLDEGETPNLFARIEHMMASNGISFDEVRQAPRSTMVLPPLDAGRFYDEHLQTDDRRVDCCPPVFAEALERAETIFRELEAEPAGTLKLITRRDPFMHNSWYHNVPRMKPEGRERNALYMHPDDARERGLAEDAVARIRNGHGEVEAPVRFDDGLRRGVVAMTHGWGNARTPGMRLAHRTPGANANRLLPTGPGSYEVLSNQAFMTGVPVEVEPRK